MSEHIHDDFVDGGTLGATETLHSFLESIDTLPVVQRYKREMRPRLALQAGDRLLDIGCGVGLEACRMADEYPEVDVIGLDREAMVREAAHRAQELDADVRWLVGEAEDIPLPDASVDACMNERVLMYLQEPARAVDEMVRVLKPGGRVASFEIDYDATLLGGDPVISGLGRPGCKPDRRRAAHGAAAAHLAEPRGPGRHLHPASYLHGPLGSGGRDDQQRRAGRN